MNQRAAIAVAAIATLLTLVGLLPVARTLANLTPSTSRAIYSATTT
ncbi:hypothetical protein [Burkholderia pseudomultivorans]|uniref:Uncharacterized protein n=1 Tax=Burkholderia pseudomultivorans TaxID=1207504 RepID=A0ABU2E4B4_9BURK|nr:hypothetical protein [Burkholderia pseudomultivorans]MDR8725723.1 hypothetical protein [Burkholderia pseudomultivorans]MDR8733180.1 hypothetical protein [Burkholderia pseudomultivorans]MDR8742875.1 hypothetical protein [Burkholderia pseudomultivorans]MDR8754685.1 hypothetical protein [Burkholderia pseudomultivorans]MDR8776153.1 hypothetical protein [Burkholderia pseudomultivorans]